jgi:hypothetical protein
MSECEEIATTINRLVEAGHIAKAQELLELSLDDYFVLKLAMFADKEVNGYTTIAAWKQAGLRLPAEDTAEFYPYGDSPSVTEEQLKAEVDKLKEQERGNTMSPSETHVATIPARPTTFKKTIRWIAVLPAAFVAANLVVLVVKFVFWLIYNNTGDWLSLASAKRLDLLANTFFVPFTFVYVGVYVAPSRKFATGIILSILCLIAITVLLAVAAIDPSIHISFFAIYAPLIYIAGISCGLFLAPIPSRDATTLKKTMRWVGVLPAAILSVVVVWFAVHWAVMLIHHFGNTGITSEETGKDLLATIPVETLERFGDVFFSPFAFIFVGARVAPSHKFAAGIFLATLYLTGMISLVTVVASQYGIHISDGPLRIVALVLTGIAGISCGLFLAHKAAQDAFINAL